MMREKEINRRQFIKRAAGTAAAAISFPHIVPASALGKAGDVAPSERITLGFIATGKQSKHLMRSFLNSPGTHVLAACDVDKLKLARGQKIVEDHYTEKSGDTYKGCKTYGDFRELLARDDIDAVVISTPDHWHAITVIQSAIAGKDIFCEKPLSQTIAEARAMVNAVRRYGRVFQTGSMQRSDWHFRLGCELVLNGYIGQLQHVTVGVGGPPRDKSLPAELVPDYLDWDMWLGPALLRPYNSELSPHLSFDGFPNWRNHSSFGGGGMTDWGAHHFDLAQWGLGKDDTGPVEIIPPDGRDHRVLTFKYADGATICHSSLDVGTGVTFLGSEGRVSATAVQGATSFEPESLQRDYAHSVHTANDLYANKGHYEDFLDCVRTRRRPSADVEIGCRTVTLCHLGNIAYELKRPLRWDPDGEAFVDDPAADRFLDRARREPWSI